MANIRQQIRKRALPCALVATLAVAGTMGMSRSNLFQSFRLKAQDLHYQWRGGLPTQNILILAIDQKSLETYPTLLAFWHPYYAEAIKAAASGGAKVMALDVAIGVPVQRWEPDIDRQLAEAVLQSASTMPVICGYIPSQTGRQREWPIPVNLAAAALGLDGFVNLTVDPDDFVRTQELLEGATGVEQPLARSFALRVAEKYVGAPADYHGGELRLKDQVVPVSADRALRINFAGPPGTYPRISFTDFLEAARAGKRDQVRQWVQGKVVLVGLDSVDDRYPTPYFPLLGSGKWNTAGIEIHASSIETLLDRRFLRPAPLWQNLILFAFVGLGTAVTTIFFPIGRAIGLVLLLVVAVLYGVHYAFRSGLLLPTLELPVIAIVSVVASSAYRFFAAEQHGKFLKNVIKVFVGEHVGEQVEASDEISTIGVRKTVTILFSDIRGFTSFCDGQDADTVVKLLNEYFSRMVAIITSHRGHVNKFIGDGILAIFSDDDGEGLSDHALRSIRCATAMIESEVPPFRTGIGIHTGTVVIGNIGSKEKMEYTALGDTVNLASRIESLNKDYHSQLLMSEATCQRLEGKLNTELLGSVQIRGKALPVRVFTLMELSAGVVAARSQT